MTPNRRKFIKDTAMAAFGTGLVSMIPLDLLAQKRRISPNEKLVIGLIGCNSMGFADAYDLLLQPDIELAAMCDIDSNVLETRIKGRS